MKIILQFLCVGSILAVLNSCTITKRHSGSGYHVEWKKNWKESDQSGIKKQEAASDTVYAQANSVSKADRAHETHSAPKERKSAAAETASGSENETDLSVIREAATSERVYSQDGINAEDQETVREEAREEVLKDVAKPEAKKKVEPLTWVALAFFLAGIGFGLLPASLFSSLMLPLILLTLLLLIAFINAVSSAMRIKRNPEKYKAKEFTWIMAFFCSLGFALALILLVAGVLFPA